MHHGSQGCHSTGNKGETGHLKKRGLFLKEAVPFLVYFYGMNNLFGMKNHLLILILLFSFYNGKSQQAETDYTWWNELHGWEEGDPGWRNWIRITPGFLGPNALPVPHVQKGEIRELSEAEIIFSNHFHHGDPTRDISAYLFWPFAQGAVAIELYGVAIEQYAFTEEIRNERFARDRDGKGIAVGDFYFSTLIQLIRNRNFPNTVLRLATKTASGNNLEAARYTDSPGYFFDLSFSKNLGQPATGIVKPFAMAGFYTWQTNDELNLQNDALLYGAGADFVKDSWLFSASLAGYSGYKNERDKPLQLNIDLRKSFGTKEARIQYHHGLRHWEYKTFRVSYIWKFKPAG